MRCFGKFAKAVINKSALIPESGRAFAKAKEAATSMRLDFQPSASVNRRQKEVRQVIAGWELKPFWLVLPLHPKTIQKHCITGF
jgi:hypothetical protein